MGLWRRLDMSSYFPILLIWQRCRQCSKFKKSIGKIYIEEKKITGRGIYYTYKNFSTGKERFIQLLQVLMGQPPMIPTRSIKAGCSQQLSVNPRKLQKLFIPLRISFSFCFEELQFNKFVSVDCCLPMLPSWGLILSTWLARATSSGCQFERFHIGYKYLGTHILKIYENISFSALLVTKFSNMSLTGLLLWWLLLCASLARP